jgi:hypothetical protein
VLASNWTLGGLVFGKRGLLPEIHTSKKSETGVYYNHNHKLATELTSGFILVGLWI